MTGRTIIVMGVCACGKSTVGEKLATRLNAKFIDGDDLHPRANIQKMARGEPLNDDDRAPWLERVRVAAYSIESKNETAIIVCSALKQQYRDTIRNGNQQVAFLYLEGSYELILARMQARSGHFMKQNMVDSQFSTLESPSQEALVVTVNIDNTIENIVTAATEQFRQLGY
ncbi:gluconokinase [Shewanella electrodiphila]|uniref:Gluconokinase n=1 Tax=Shewanella electrodiphila TaxID=934143 RepID=A0ABT0KTI1_9GAMM|nr:gluconokinase [Shewanella electrodiphila]MCL1047158.1 gluconokinase [Shewanella electrodiphila]